MGLLQDLNRRGMTVVLVTHEHDIASLASRVVVFRDGHVVDDRRVRAVDAYQKMREIASA
jgi:putative ABC transport system ATP-binding protein